MKYLNLFFVKINLSLHLCKFICISLVSCELIILFSTCIGTMRMIRYITTWHLFGGWHQGTKSHLSSLFLFNSAKVHLPLHPNWIDGNVVHTIYLDCCLGDMSLVMCFLLCCALVYFLFYGHGACLLSLVFSGLHFDTCQYPKHFLFLA